MLTRKIAVIFLFIQNSFAKIIFLLINDIYFFYLIAPHIYNH